MDGILPKGSPPHSLQRMGFASRGSPSLSPRGSLLQVNEILLKGLPYPQRMGFASRESPSQQRMRFASRGSPSPERMGFASRGSPSPKRMGFASRGSPSPKRIGFASDARPSCSKRPLSRDSPSPRPRCSRDSLSPKGFASSPKQMGFVSRDSLSPKRQRFESRDSDSPRRQHSSRASSREASVERPQSWSSPVHPYSPSREDKEAEDTYMPASVKAMVDFILQSFPEATASPAHPSSRSFDLSASAGFTDAATPSGSLLVWCHAMSDAFSDTQKMEGFVIPYYLLSTDSRESPIRLLREKSWRLIQIFWIFYGTRSRFSVICPFLSKRALLSRGHSGHALSLITFSPGWWWLWFVLFMRRNFCLRTIQLSPSCRSPFPRSVAVWLLPHLHMLPSSPWRGDISSVESACSATCDLSLFKPHLKTSSSTTPSRRSPCSSSRSRRALLDNFSCQSSSQRSPSSFRLYCGKKGDSRFQKKSSATPHNGEVVGSKSLVPLWRSVTA